MRWLRYGMHFFYKDILQGTGVCGKWQKLEKSQWWSRERTIANQQEKLVRLLKHAAEEVPYYRDFCRDHGISSFNDTEILKKFPIIDKSDFRIENGRFSVENKERYKIIKSSTSGSTGENFFFLLDKERLAWAHATHMRGTCMAGIDPFDRKSSLWGASFDLPERKTLIDAFRNYSMPFLFLSSYDLSEKRMAAYSEQLLCFGPALLTSYSSPLEQFAQYLKANKINLPSLRSIVCSAEQLFDHQRELFQEVFHVPVYNRYGSREFGHIAQECSEHKGLHIAADRVYVEIVDDNGDPCLPGETGHLVITDLDNYAMPFIRYKIGDMATVSDGRLCPCGRGLPLLEAVEGRSFDMIRSKGGSVLSGTFWTLLARNISEDIKAFQVRQDVLEEVRIYLQMARGEKLTAIQQTKLLGEISKAAPDLTVKIEYVDVIPLTKSGKRRFVVSSLSLGQVK